MAGRKKEKQNIVLDQNGEEIRFKKSKKSFRERVTAGLFLSPSFFGVLLFFVAPFAVVFFYAGIDNLISKQFVGLDNYKNVLENSAFQDAAKNTATFSLIAVPLAIIL